MSHSIGPVHHWLYNQIKLVERRENDLIEKIKEKYEIKEVEKIVEQVREKYGQLKKDKPLAELIGDNAIHAWLEEAIVTAQTREAELIKLVQEKYDNKELLSKVYYITGVQAAKSNKQSEEENDLQETFELLNNNFLERMPCDRLSSVVSQNESELIWQHDKSLHTEFWQQVNVSIDLMHELYSNWIEGFISTINSNISHQRVINDQNYKDMFTFEK